MAWGSPYLRAAEGQTIRIAAEEHPFAPVLRDYRKGMVYRAIFDEAQAQLRQGTRIIAQGGVGAPVAVEFAVEAAAVSFLPIIADDSGSLRGQVAARVITALEQMQTSTSSESATMWERSVVVPGLEQLEATLEEAERAVGIRHGAPGDHAFPGRRAALPPAARHARRRRPHQAVADALVLLGFTITARHASTLEIESEGVQAIVECEGSQGEVVEWPYIRLQRRLEAEPLKTGSAPHGLIVRERSPDEGSR